MEQISVSIITASYNYASIIGRTIESLVSQSYDNFEVIVVDDGSQDNSLQVIGEYVKAHSNVHLYCHPGNANKGLPATIQLGLSKSKGDYIAFCESDDYWSQDHLVKIVEVIKSDDDVRIVSNGVKLIDGGGNIDEHLEEMHRYIDRIERSLSDGPNIIDLCGNSFNPVPTLSAVTIEAALLRTLDFNTPISQWIDFWLYRQIFSKHRLYHTSEKITYWNIHQGSYNSIPPTANDFIKLSDMVIKGKYVKSELEIISESPLFDSAWYVSKYGNQIGKEDPARFYLEIGWLLGHNPSVGFSTDGYLNRYLDIRNTGLNPLLHYEMDRGGRFEGREIIPVESTNEIGDDDIEYIQAKKQKGKVVLLIGHEHSLTGAPRALLNMAIALKNQGATPVMISDVAGPLEKEIDMCGIKSHVIENLKISLATAGTNILKRYVSLFDVVVFNTAVTAPLVVSDAFNDPVKISWLHEGTFTYEGNLESQYDLKTVFSLFDYVYAVGNYSRRIAEQYIGRKCGIMYYGIQEIPKLDINPIPGNEIKMLIAGSICKRKGQLILLDALSRVSEDVRNKIRVYIVGSVDEEKYFNAIKNYSFDCVEYLGSVEHEELMKLFQNIDVLLCPSLDDPMPIVCTEAIALNKLIVVSDATGTASLIENGVNGFFVKAGNSKELADVLTVISQMDRATIEEMGQRAYSIYSRNFTMEHHNEEVKLKVIDTQNIVQNFSKRVKSSISSMELSCAYTTVKQKVVKNDLNFRTSMRILCCFWRKYRSLNWLALFFKLFWYRTIGKHKIRRY